MRSQDKRKYIRLKVYHLVKYRLLSEENKQTAPVVATIKDIGGGGVCLRTDEYLPVASLLELSINFPHSSTPISVLAKVAWIKSVRRTSRYEAGIQFVEISDPLRHSIEDHIKYVYKKAKK